MIKLIIMKIFYKLSFLIAFVIISVQLAAQDDIPNPGFENWSQGEPTDWNTSNRNLLGTDFICVTSETNNPHSGNISAKLQSMTKNIFLVGPVTLPGILTLGEVIVDLINMTGTVEGGVPVSGQPVKLRGYFKYDPQNGDSCMMGIGLTRWNGVSRDTIAFSYKIVGDAINEWTEFSIPIHYLQWAQPDTMNILFSSSYIPAGMPVGQSSLIIDDLWLDYSQVSIQDAGFDKNTFLTTSVDGNSLNVISQNGQIKEVKIYSLTSNLAISIGNVYSNECRINIGTLASGFYVAQITMSNRESKTIKFYRH